MAGFFHFDVAALVPWLGGGLIAAAAYYVKTQIALSRGGDLAKLATTLIEKIDGVKDAVNNLNLTLVRSEERIAQHARDIERHDQRLSALESRR